MGMACSLIRLSDQNITALSMNSKLIYQFLGIEVAQSNPGGLFSHLLNVRKKPH